MRGQTVYPRPDEVSARRWLASCRRPTARRRPAWSTFTTPPGPSSSPFAASGEEARRGEAAVRHPLLRRAGHDGRRDRRGLGGGTCSPAATPELSLPALPPAASPAAPPPTVSVQPVPARVSPWRHPPPPPSSASLRATWRPRRGPRWSSVAWVRRSPPGSARCSSERTRAHRGRGRRDLAPLRNRARAAPDLGAAPRAARSSCRRRARGAGHRGPLLSLQRRRHGARPRRRRGAARRRGAGVGLSVARGRRDLLAARARPRPGLGRFLQDSAARGSLRPGNLLRSGTTKRFGANRHETSPPLAPSLPISAQAASVSQDAPDDDEAVDIAARSIDARAHRGALGRALGGPGVDVEDVVHEVFLIAKRRLRAFRGDAKI